MEQKKKKRFVVIGIIAGLIAVTGVIYFFVAPSYESTDNAQLDGDIVSVRSGVTAYVERVSFTDNQLVKKGDTLIVFDADEMKAKVLQAEAALENAKANVDMTANHASATSKNAHAYVQSAQSNQQSVAGAKAKLEKTQKAFDRVTELMKIKGATQEQFDDAQSDLQIAKSEYARAIDQQQSSVSSSLSVKAQAKADENQIDLARTVIKQREAELVLARKQLSYAYVIAPCNGVVSKRSFNKGQYISAGQSLCTVVNIEHYWITANFKETQLSHIKIGSEVEIELDSYPGLKLKGKVESYGGATGAKFALLPPDNATGNFIKITQRFPLRISIDNFPKEKATEIFPGLSAFVKVKAG